MTYITIKNKKIKANVDIFLLSFWMEDLILVWLILEFLKKKLKVLLLLIHKLFTVNLLMEKSLR